jgi:hypothetical protein
MSSEHFAPWRLAHTQSCVERATINHDFTTGGSGRDDVFGFLGRVFADLDSRYVPVPRSTQR